MKRVNAMPAPKLTPGFLDPVFDSQAVFRTAMSATAYPGRVFRIGPFLAPPPPLGGATAALCLTVADFETMLYVDALSPEVLAWLRFHCGAPVSPDADDARFGLITDPSTMPKFTRFNAGDVEYPDRSTTLIIQVPSLTDGPVTSWSGPGIKNCITPGIAGLPEWFWPDWDLGMELYPRGIDVFFTSGAEVIGLPRTIKVEA